MKNRRKLLAVALALSAGIILAFSAQATTFNVEVANVTFAPQVVSIGLGDTVHWFWVSGIHTTTSGNPCVPNGIWDAPIDQTHPTFDFTFNTAGSFAYLCRFHCGIGMTGTVIVGDPTGLAPQSGSGDGLCLTASPNPFQSPTSIRFELPSAGPARVAVFDAAGRQVASLAQGEFSAGAHSVPWDGRSDSGEVLPNGIYFAKAWTRNGTATASMVKLQ